MQSAAHVTAPLLNSHNDEKDLGGTIEEAFDRPLTDKFS